MKHRHGKGPLAQVKPCGFVSHSLYLHCLKSQKAAEIFVTVWNGIFVTGSCKMLQVGLVTRFQLSEKKKSLPNLGQCSEELLAIVNSALSIACRRIIL